MKINKWKKSSPWRLVYGPEEEAAAAVAAAAAKTAADKAAADAEAAKKAADGNDDDKPTISQKKMNDILKKEKEKYKKDTEKQIQDLESLRTSKNLTEAEKDRLAARIEDLNSSMLTKEEMAAKDRKKLQDEAAEKEKKLTHERDSWKSKFETATIKRAITDGAVKAETFSPPQIVELLQSKARLVPVVDASNNETGEYTTKIQMADKNKEGQPVVLDLDVDQALKTMKDRADEFGNLFKSGVSGGLGASGGAQGAGKDKDPAKMTHPEYLKWRKTQGLGPKVTAPKT